MESGVNARAIDYAKFGQLFLNGGSWQGSQIISRSWVDESTRPYLPQDDAAYYPDRFAEPFGQMYYGYMWWGVTRPDGSYDFLAWGDHGQFIYVSPQKNLVIVRNGLEYGIPETQWVEFFYKFASQY
jgi:CubicO group peptidase (beta-lactamase class C family)